MHIITQVLALVEEKYSDNPGLTAIAGELKLLQCIAQNANPTSRGHMAAEHGFMLAAYRRGAQGEVGYGLMSHFDSALVEGMMKEISALREVETATRLLVIALQAHGEAIEY